MTRSASAAAAPGILVVLEGLDGAGTTTQSRILLGRLRDLGRGAHLTREPSDGPIGSLLRQMIAGAHGIEGARITSSTFGPLFAADRMDHLQREVDPRLLAGDIVISDRWYHSTYAYQATPTDLPWFMALNERARRPDLVVFLRIDPDLAAQRRISAGRCEEIFEDVVTQRRVSSMYDLVIQRLRSSGERIEVVDGSMSVDEVARAVLSALDRVAPLSPLPPSVVPIVSAPVYVEHHNPHVPYNVRRYDSMEDAIYGVSRGTHLSLPEIDEGLRDGGRVWLGLDWWRVVSIADMRERAGIHSRAAAAMERGEDIDEDDLP